MSRPAHAAGLFLAIRPNRIPSSLSVPSNLVPVFAWIEQHHLKQSEAAEILMVSRPRVSDVVNKKTAKFTIDTLVEMMSRIGKPVTLAVG
jgi:predicted XRE-type DNA-binding protein